MKEHPLAQAFKMHLNKEFPYLNPGQDAGLLLAISGGMDSVVLAELLSLTGYRTVWAHCNFHLRGAESDRDEAFVRKLAADKDIKLKVVSFDTTEVAGKWKMSIEETARKLRYDWFEKLLTEPGLFDGVMDNPVKKGYLLTAHHGNDHIETLLLNFFRGCGMAGLHGIPSRNASTIRPLLIFKRALLEGFAQDQNLQWVEDSTNQSVDYTRNFFRQEMLPAIGAYFPGVEDNLLDNIGRFCEAELLYKESLAKYRKQLMIASGKEYLLSVRLLIKSGIIKTLLWETLKDFGFGHAQIPEVEKLLYAPTGAYQQSKSHRIFRNRAHLVLTTLRSTESETILITQQDKEISFGAHKLSIAETLTSKMETDPHTAYLEAGAIEFPLLLRKWQQGDYFYPLGMRKKKKLSRFFTDQKLSKTEKEEAWVLLSQGKVLWVVGRRIDDRFKIKASSKKILKLKVL